MTLACVENEKSCVIKFKTQFFRVYTIRTLPYARNRQIYFNSFSICFCEGPHFLRVLFTTLTKKIEPLISISGILPSKNLHISSPRLFLGLTFSFESSLSLFLPSLFSLYITLWFKLIVRVIMNPNFLNGERYFVLFCVLIRARF